LSSALSLINIYVCTKFNFNPFCTFQDMARHAPIMKKWLRGDNYVNIHDRIIVFVHCTFPHCYLSINQVSIISISLVLSKIWPGQASIMKNDYGEITQ